MWCRAILQYTYNIKTASFLRHIPSL